MATPERIKLQTLFLLCLLNLLLAGIVFGEGFKIKEGDSSYSFPQLIKNGGYTVAAKSGILQHRGHEPFTPASTLKIVTTLAAIELLGPDFHFETRLYVDDQHNLFVKGFGDPFLVSEELLRLCLQLREKGVLEVEHIYLDSGYFQLENSTPGSRGSSNPYDASNGSLAVNFNSLSIHKNRDGTVVSGEPQTPTLPLMQRIACELSPGMHRINVDRVKGTKKIPSSLQYVGELLIAQLQKADITVKGGFTTGPVPAKLSPVLCYQSSKNLMEIMEKCLYYSNNFIANQVFLFCGARYNGGPATWEKAQSFLRDYLTRTFHFSPDQFTIHDGSGLSRKNIMSTESLVKILYRFAPYKELLPITGNTYIKSGTLNGVYCYAGYFPHAGSTYPFALFLNQQNNTRDQLLQELRKLSSQ